MDIRKVKKLIELLEESGVTEIEVCEGEESVRISRQVNAPGAQTVLQVPEVVQAASMPVAPASATSQSNDSGDDSPKAAHEDGQIITAPMVGIFYASPAPGEPAYTQVGQQVSSGEVVCVIEAMKIMNQIESDSDGEIVKIHVDNGEPVEYGQALFTLR